MNLILVVVSDLDLGFLLAMILREEVSKEESLLQCQLGDQLLSPF